MSPLTIICIGISTVGFLPYILMVKLPEDSVQEGLPDKDKNALFCSSVLEGLAVISNILGSVYSVPTDIV